MVKRISEPKKSRLNLFLNQTISNKWYILIFSTHLTILSLILLMLNSIDYRFGYELVGGFFGFADFFMVRPIIVLIMNVFPKFPVFPFTKDVEFNFITWLVPLYLAIGFVWIFFRSGSKITKRYLFISSLISWIVLILLAIVFFHSQLGE